MDVDAMEWTPLGPAGLYSKLLSRDEETGSRTALQRLNPDEGYEPPTIAHYHTTYEEILGVKGWFSFDQRTWVRPCSYVFHPPRTVHGFASAVPKDSWFLSRVGRNLDVNLVEHPSHDDLYTIEGDPPVRSAKAVAEPMQEIGFESAEISGGSGPVEWCALSVDPQTGEGSALVRFPDGWKLENGKFDGYLEFFVMEGLLAPEAMLDDGPEGMSYSYYPPADAIVGLAAKGSTLAYVNFGKSILA